MVLKLTGKKKRILKRMELLRAGKIDSLPESDKLYFKEYFTDAEKIAVFSKIFTVVPEEEEVTDCTDGIVFYEEDK